MKVWAIVIGIAILAGLVGGLVHLSKKAARVDAAEARAAAAEQLQVDQAKKFANGIELFGKQQEADQKADAALVQRITALEGVAAALNRAASRIKPSMEKPDAQGTLRAVIAPDWWLCRSAQLSGDSADTAACIASPSAGTVPTTVSP